MTTAEKSAGLLHAGEAANYLSVSEAQIRRLEQRGELPAVRFGKTVRFRREDLDRFIEDHLVGSEGA